MTTVDDTLCHALTTIRRLRQQNADLTAVADQLDQRLAPADSRMADLGHLGLARRQHDRLGSLEHHFAAPRNPGVLLFIPPDFVRDELHHRLCRL